MSLGGYVKVFALIRLALAGERASHLCIMEQLPLAIVGFEFAARSTTPGEGNDNVFLDSFVEDWLKKGLEKIRKVWYHKV